MLIRQDMMNKIKDYFELNTYETKVWLALLGKGVASAGQIAQISRVPRSRTYDVLEGLEKKGFAIVKLGKPVKYIGVKPQVIIEKLKNNVKRDAQERIKSLGKVKETEEFEKLQKLYDEGINPIKREDISAAIKGRSNISNYLKEILQEAKEEVIICTNASDMLSKIKLFKQTIDMLNKEKIRVRVALSGNETLVKTASNEIGMEVVRLDIEAKFFVVDRKEILLYLTKSGDKTSSADDIAIWINSDFFAQSFSTLFDKAVGVKGGK
jgi:sugar-specific transcriptional regulator TrmB